MNNILDSINTIMRTLVLLLFATISFRGYSQPQPTLILPDYDQYERCLGLAFNPQKTFYYNLNSSGVLKFYESSTNKLLHSIGTDSLKVTQAIFVEEKRVLISAFSNSRKNKNLDTYRVYLFDLETSEIIYVFKEINLKGDLNKSKNGEQLFTFKAFEYSQLDFNKSKSLISIRYGEKLEVWNLQTLERVKKIKNVRGNAKFSSDGDFVLWEDYLESNILELGEANWTIFDNRKKSKCLKGACAIEVIAEKNIVLIGNQKGEMIVANLNNWDTLKEYKLSNNWLHYIKYDRFKNEISTSATSGNNGCVINVLNADTYETAFEIYVESNIYYQGYPVVLNSTIDEVAGRIYVNLISSGGFDREFVVLDLVDKKRSVSYNIFSLFNEDNISTNALLIPDLQGAKVLKRSQSLSEINTHRFNENFISNNEKYFAHVESRSKENMGILIWDLNTGLNVVSDSVLSTGNVVRPLGFDYTNKYFYFKEDYRLLSKLVDGVFVPFASAQKIIAADIQNKEILVAEGDAETLSLQNKIQDNLNSRYFVNDYRPFRKNVIKSKIVDSLGLTVKTLNSTKIDTCHLVNQSDYLIFILDSLKSETIRFVDSETNRILWQKNYNSAVSYNICGNGEFILISESKELGLHLIEIKSGQRINLVEHSEKELHVALQFEYKLNFEGEWLVLQKSRKAFGDFYEFEFWNISQKTKMFELTSLGELSSTNIMIDTKLNRFISNHSGQFNYYSLSDGTKLGQVDLDVEFDFSGYNNNDKTFWLTDDNKYLIVADGTSPNKVSVYDNATLKKLYTRIQSPDGNWIAFDKDLNYDGSEGALKEVYYVKGLQVLSDYVPKEFKHIPGLIEKIMSH